MKIKKTFFLLLFICCVSPNSEEIQLNNKFDDSLLDDSIVTYCNNLDFEVFSGLNYSDIKTLKIETPKSLAWYKNLSEAFIDGGGYPTGYIKNKYKETFYANISVIYEDFQCDFKSDIRISGDWKDHIVIEKRISSLDVKLLDGNIFGVTKFKLLLPHTRRSDNEIITTTIFSNMGFISPQTFYVNVNLNGFDSSRYIFQEKVAKELIERSGYREGPLVEINEKYYWETSTGLPFKEEGLIFTNAKPLNLYWARRSDVNSYITLLALEKLNRGLFSTINSNYDFINYPELSEQYQELYEYDALALSLEAAHALRNHNRKFYYDRINETFEPIYYDGNSNILINEEIENVTMTKDIPILNYYETPNDLGIAATNLLNKINNNQLNTKELFNELIQKGASVTFLEVDNAISKMLLNLNYLSTLQNEKKLKNENNLSFSKYKEIAEEVIFYDFNSQIFTVCDSKIKNCSLLANEQKINIFDKENKNIKSTNFIGFSKDLNEDKKDLKKIELKNFKIFYVGNPQIYLDENKKIIEINLLNSDDRVLFKNSQVHEYHIIINSNMNIPDNFDSRYNENLLTGCVTFYNVEFKNTIIESANSICEDSLNFIDVFGEVDQILINNSFQDAFDIDFSTLSIKEITINDSGNDCLDISGSNINIENINLLNCKDKGISIGEVSKININNLSLKSASIGIAVKDSSTTELKNFNSEMTDICFAIYRKKQEFGPSYLNIEENNCVGTTDYQVQNGSKYEN